MLKPAAIKSGLICGLVIGLAINWFVMVVLYQSIYQISYPEIPKKIVSVVAAFFLFLAIFNIGRLAVHWSGSEVQTWRQGGIVGVGAGFIVGVVGYLINGVLVSTLMLGVAPLVGYLVEPTNLNGANMKELLYSVVKSAIPAIYLSILGYIVFWGILGGIGGIVTVKTRSLIRKKSDFANITTT